MKRWANVLAFLLTLIPCCFASRCSSRLPRSAKVSIFGSSSFSRGAAPLRLDQRIPRHTAQPPKIADAVKPSPWGPLAHRPLADFVACLGARLTVSSSCFFPKTMFPQSFPKPGFLILGILGAARPKNQENSQSAFFDACHGGQVTSRSAGSASWQGVGVSSGDLRVGEKTLGGGIDGQQPGTLRRN